MLTDIPLSIVGHESAYYVDIGYDDGMLMIED